jgi:hypothetical protein
MSNFPIIKKWFSQIWLQAKYESNFFLKATFYIFGYVLEPCMEIWWIFLNFGLIMAIENLRKHLI